MSDTEIPTVISADSVGEWSDSVDVLVVGMGIAGCCAAIAAAEAGARVLALERAGAIGGTSALAGGHFYLGAGTAVQEATGHGDSVEEMVKYLEAVSPDPDSAKIRAYCEGSVEHFEWLESVGVEFERTFYPGKNVVQPGTEGLMFTGNEKVWPFRDQAVPAPRGHKVRAPSATGGAEMMRTFLQRLTQLDIPVRFDTGAIALVADAAGRIVGVQWRRFDEVGTIRAGSVILAAGGYVMNRDMIEAHTPRLNARFMPLGTTYDDGLGIRLGLSAGAGLAHMSGAFLTASFYPPADLLKGIIVNQAGERFVAEDSYHSRTAAAVLEQPGAKAFLILDDTNMAWPELQLVKFIDGFDSIDGLERTLGIPAGALQRTLAD